jgi:hypothetical protein
MKKVLVALLVLVIAGVAFLYFPRGGVVEAVNAAVLAVLNSGVDASRQGGDFQIALDGDVFATGDVVRADDKGRAVLTFFDGSTISVDPQSRVVVKSLTKTSGGGIQLQIEQTAGRTWASVSKLATPDSKFEIKTPSMVAVVRGTTFETIVLVLPNGQTTTKIKTNEGEVLVQPTTGVGPAGPPITVAAGNEVDVAQGEAAPVAAKPQPPTPKLRLSGPAGVNFTVIDPRGLQCGTGGATLLRQIPRCDVLSGAGQTVVIGEVVPGLYGLIVTVPQAVQDAAIVAEGLGISGGNDFTAKLARPLAAGDLLRVSLPLAIGADGKMSSGGFTQPELISSVCGAEATGRVFSSGKLTERADAFVSFAAQSKGAAAAIVYTQAELTQAAVDGLKDAQAQLPVTVSNVKVTVDNAGVHLTADVAAGPLNIGTKGDVIAGATTEGKLLMKMRSIDAGPLPSAAKEQIIAAIDRGLSTFAESMPLSVQRVAFRTGCFALIGKTPN